MHGSRVVINTKSTKQEIRKMRGEREQRARERLIELVRPDMNVLRARSK